MLRRALRPFVHLLLLAVRGSTVLPAAGWHALSSSAPTVRAAPSRTFPGATPDSASAGFTAAFVPNVGQTDPAVQFQTSALGGALFFTSDAVVLALPTPDPNAPRPTPDRAERGPAPEPPAPLPPSVLRLRFAAANATPAIRGMDRLPGVINFIRGADPANWQTGVPAYAGISYDQLYPGIDLHYTSADGYLKGTYHVAPGADPRQIRWRYDGASSVQVDAATGDLVIALPTDQSSVQHRISTLIEQAPVAWQEIDGQRVPVAASYAIAPDESISFVLGAYDSSQALTLDPTLIYGTYLGGNFSDDGRAIAVDPEGNIYVTGYTLSLNFPLANAFQGSRAGAEDVFVSKFSPSGDRLLYSTYLGGSGRDIGEAIAVDAAGNVYLTGETYSTNFPLEQPWQGSNDGKSDVFLTKLTADGSALVYSTYLGGTSHEIGYGIAVDGDRAAYITGYTGSENFPTFAAYQASLGGESPDYDAFVTKFPPDGSAPVYSTFLGGTNYDFGYAIAVDSAGHAYVTGLTSSNNFPLHNPRQSTYRGSDDAFVTKVQPDGSDLVYSTYHGGSDWDSGKGITVDLTGSAYVVGFTQSENFPLQSAFQSTRRGFQDAFVSRLTSTGGLSYSTYLGGDRGEQGYGIAVDSFGQAHISGQTTSSNLPTPFGHLFPYNSSGSGTDGFVATLHPQGNALMSSTYLGGSDTDILYGIAAGRKPLESPDPDTAEPYYVEGINHVTGVTYADNFPTRAALQATSSSIVDAVMAKVSPYPAATASYYITTAEQDTLYNLGCRRGERDRDMPGKQDSLIILAFGQPWEESGVYGVRTLSQQFLTVSQVEILAQEFGKGYWDCVAGDDSSRLRLAIGTSNLGDVTTFDHGVAWARMVNNVQQWLILKEYNSQIVAAGASDMEVGWNDPVDTRAWVDGYVSTAVMELYNFGDAQACPPATPECDFDWTQEDIWYVSWGASPLVSPIPQIYRNDGLTAQQWYEIAVYSVETQQEQMLFAGALTQYQACIDRPDYESVDPPSRCRGGDQPPEHGWRQLWTEMNNDSRTAHDLRWSSDIRWDYLVGEY